MTWPSVSVAVAVASVAHITFGRPVTIVPSCGRAVTLWRLARRAEQGRGTHQSEYAPLRSPHVLDGQLRPDLAMADQMTK